jgi:flagellar protein FlbD
VLKLTRLNRYPVAVNPDHISWIDAVPDTTLCLVSGDKLIVRETIDELIEQLVAYRRLIRAAPAAAEAMELVDVDLPPIDLIRGLRRVSRDASPASQPPSTRRRGGGEV